MIEFTVYGEPMTQGSFAAILSRTTGRAFLKASNETKWKNWRKAINAMAVRAWGDDPPTDLPLLCEVRFFFGPPPKARAGEVYCSTKGDGDKLMRAVLDGMTAMKGKKPTKGLMTNDARVVHGTWIKYWCDSEQEQRAEVRIDSLDRSLVQKTSTLGI